MHRKCESRHLCCLLLLVCLACVPTHVASAQDTGLSDAQVDRVLQGCDVRRDVVLRAVVAEPYPKTGLWRHSNFALAALYLNVETDRANEELLTLYQKFLAEELPNHYDGTESDPAKNHFYWHTNQLQRIYWLFGSGSEFFPGRLTPETEGAIVDMLWRYSSTWCRRDMADAETTWYGWGSENHQAQAWSSFWGAAQILSRHPDYRDRTYEDGTPVVEMAELWNTYYRRYVRERAGKGLLWEIASPTYAKYTLQGWYNVADFADDPVLKQRMRMLLDLYWADWAVEQIDGIRGGSRHRCYAGVTSTGGSGAADIAYLHFGLGRESNRHPATVNAAASAYRPPAVVVDMAHDVAGRAKYTYTSRRPGLEQAAPPEVLPPWVKHAMNPDDGGILRVTHCTPEYILGSSMIAPRPLEDWCAGSAQNRWDGVIFADDPLARIFFQARMSKGKSLYNTHWSLVSRGVMIVQKLPEHKHAGPMRVWFPSVMPRVARDDYVLAESPEAYAALRVVEGGYHWEPDTDDQHRKPGERLDLGVWLECNDEFTPLILEVAAKCDVGDLDAFEQLIASAHVGRQDGILHYRSAIHAEDLTFHTDFSGPPEVNGQPVDLTPTKVYDCPFIQSDWDSGVVTLMKGERVMRLDFNRK